MTAQLSAALRVPLSHAWMQHLAESSGLTALHIKGPALDESLRAAPGALRQSSDVDLLVPPHQAQDWVERLRHNDWRLYTSFEAGFPFRHAATLWHDYLGYVDIHRWFPGVEREAESAFELLWSSRKMSLIAHHSCPVPNPDAQRLLLLLHYARTPESRVADYQRAWTQATSAQQAAVRELASQLKADVALAAALGELADHQDRASFELWHGFSSAQSSRSREWWARVKAEPGRIAKLRLAGRAFLVNRERLQLELGHRPTRTELVRAYGARYRKAYQELRARMGNRDEH